MKIGARTIKTGLAITLALVIGNYFDIKPAIFAAISAMVNLKPSVFKSFRNAIEQVSITSMGILIGLALALTLGNSPVVVGLSSILVISIAHWLKWNAVIPIGVMTAIFVMDAPTANFFDHAVTRIQLIGIGLGVALAINILLAPPKHLEMLKQKIADLHDRTTTFFNEGIFVFMQRSNFNEERILELEELLMEAAQIHDLVEEIKGEAGI